MKTPCIARVEQPPHFLHTHACTRPATADVNGYAVCGVHARVARRWVQQGRLDAMVSTYWKGKKS